MGEPSSAELEVMFRVCAAAHAAYREANGSPHRADIVAMGADGSPTEEIDRIAETQILATLEHEEVGWDVVSEEIGQLRRGGERTLVIDPIDGSHNALRRMPFAAVSLALGRTDLAGIDIGVVHDLATGVTYWAERGKGAFRDGRPLRARAWNPKAELVFLNLGRHATPKVVGWAGRARRVRSLGCASLEMIMVAQGSADGYFFENDVDARNLRVTDIAGAYRIVQEAGGGVANAGLESLEPFPLELGRRTSVFAWGDPHFRDDARTQGFV
ncbi:MAG TPA: inositol monophosphatase family protein [Thermoplasmata archaeon]|nr:inositol monophosphatase family protein [Thermoplasmata archaeon]